MHLIIGLGNPGGRYKGTRHNVGFETIDKLCFDHKITVKNNQRFRAFVGEGRIGGKPVLLVQPMTYMNLSGEAVRKILHFYKLTSSEMIVIYDDVNLPVGDIRVRERGSAAGQKGMINIIAQLKTDEFPRIRIGIGDKPPGMKLTDYVLSRFFKQEWDDMIQGITKAGDAAELILTEGTNAAMNKYNTKMFARQEQKKRDANTIKLVRPNMSFKAQYEEMMQEWLASGGSVSPAALLSSDATYETWLQWMKNDARENTCPPESIPQTMYFAILNGKLVGAVSIRHGGEDHVGFGVRPTQRQKGYGKEILRLALAKLKERGITDVIVNCPLDNLPSQKTILACGGVLQKKFVDDEGNLAMQFLIQNKEDKPNA